MGVEGTKMWFLQLFCHFNKKFEKWPIPSFSGHLFCQGAVFTCYLETLQHLSLYCVLGSLCIYHEVVYFYCCVIDVSLLSLPM